MANDSSGLLQIRHSSKILRQGKQPHNRPLRCLIRSPVAYCLLEGISWRTIGQVTVRGVPKDLRINYSTKGCCRAPLLDNTDSSRALEN